MKPSTRITRLIDATAIAFLGLAIVAHLAYLIVLLTDTSP